MKHIITMILLIAITLSGCATQTQSDKLKVISTLGQINDIVKNVGGEDVEATALMGPGVDPHLYQASARDVSELANADIIFYNGLHLEAKMGDVLEKMEERKTTVAVTQKIPKDQLKDFTGYPGFYDPHVWFDVTMWQKAVRQVRDTLSEKDPKHKQEYEKRAAAYLTKLDKLDEYVQKQTESIPEEQRIIITAHDAFNYLGTRYGFEVKGLQGISTQSKAGTADVKELADFITERKIKAMFVETSVPKRNIKAVQEAVESRGWTIKIGGYLYSDAMGDEGTSEGTYIGMVKHNIDTITKALGE